MAGNRNRARAPRRAGPHLRAGLVLLHALAVLVLSLPAGSRMRDRLAWQTPQHQAELARWAGRLSALGLAVTPAEFEDLLWDVASRYLAVRDAVAAPAERYAALTGSRQGWSMFAQPQTHPARLNVEVDLGAGAFEGIYVARSAAHRWRHRQLDHNRVRKLLGRIARDVGRAPYGELVQWLGRKAAHDFPDARRLRVRLERWQTRLPHVRSPRQTSFTDERVIDLEALR